MRCFQCYGRSVGVLKCRRCDARLGYCRKHKYIVQCNCTPPGQGAASAAAVAVPVPVWLPSPLPNPRIMGHVHLARRVSNELQEPRNRVNVLSFNLQNFTGDHRMGRSNGAIGSPENQLRARFVGELMRATGAHVLLAMETGSDVSAAMEAIRRSAGEQFHVHVSERTHETPQLSPRHRIAFRFRRSDVWHLRNLLDMFAVAPTPDTRREVSARQALELMCDVRGLSLPPELGDYFVGCESWARRAAHGRPLLLAGARGLLNWGNISDANTLEEMLTSLRCLRLAARDARQWELVFATECLELLRLIDCTRPGAPLALDGDLFERLRLCGPQAERFRHEKNLPLCLYVLMAHRSLDLAVDQADAIHRHPDARMAYDALAHFGCVEFHYETYGVLMDGSALRLADFDPQHHICVLRFGPDGQPLATQAPGSAYNWRSALRMFVPLQGVEWVQMLLFHTRFTVRGEDLEGRAGTVEEETYRIRAGGVVAIGEAVANDGLAYLPTLYCGDFNLPVSQQSAALQEFDNSMQSFGYKRYPESLPATTLCSIPTLTEEPEGAYSKSYDGAYARNIGEPHIACEVLALAELAKLVDPEVISQLMPIVARYYDRQVRALLARLENALGVLERMRSTGMSGVWATARLKSRFLVEPGTVIAEINFRSAGFGRLSMFRGGDVLGVLLNELKAGVESALSWGMMQDLPDRMVLWLVQVREDIAHAATVLGNLEQSAAVRFAVGYQSCISDHLPLLTVLDLDYPVKGHSSSGPSASSSSAAIPAFASGPPFLSAPSVPVNAEDFLAQQGAGAAAMGRYRRFLDDMRLVEGRATSDSNTCLLHTLGQHVFGSDNIAVAARVGSDVGVAPGPMLAIGDGPFPDYLRRRGLTVRLWLLAHDGSVGQAILIGAPEGTGRIVDVLHYGAHYVPLWPRPA